MKFVRLETTYKNGSASSEPFLFCTGCHSFLLHESNFCPSCGEKNNDITDKMIFIVTYWDNGLEPVVTAFNNQVSAEKCYSYFKKEHDGCCIDEVPVYKHFGKQESK